MLLEVAAGTLVKAVITRLGTDAAGKVIRNRRDRDVLKEAIETAARDTDAEYRRELERYDVNVGFFEHEGAAEIAKVLLGDARPNGDRASRQRQRRVLPLQNGSTRGDSVAHQPGLPASAMSAIDPSG